MRLLSAIEVKTEQSRREESVSLQLSRLNEQVSAKTKEMNQLETSLQSRVSLIQSEIMQKEQELMKKIAALTTDVRRLEARRREALEPLEAHKEEITKLLVLQKEKEQYLSATERALNKRKARLNTLDNKIEDREFAVADAELSLQERMKLFEMREAGLANNESAFNSRLLEANEAHLKREQELKEKEALLTAGMEWTARREEALTAEKVVLEERAKSLLATEVRLSKHFKTLKDKGLL